MSFELDVSKLPDYQARDQLVRTTILAVAAGLIGLFTLPFLGAIALGAGARGLVLSQHKGCKAKPNIMYYRIGNAIFVALGILEMIYQVTRLN